MIRVAEVDHLDQEVGVVQLLERGAERLDQVGRQIADEADRVGQHHLALAREAEPAADRVEGGEQLVLDQRVPLGEGVEQGRLAGVGVADDRHDRHLALAAPTPPEPAPLGHFLPPLLEQRDPLARAAARHLELGLTGAAPADPAGEPRHHRVLLDQPRQRVLELGELDLQLAVPAGRVLGEDVEDEHRAVEDLELGEVADRARLAGREVLIEDHRVGAELHGAQEDLLELALADQELRVDRRAALNHDVEDIDPCGAAELAQLGDARVRVDDTHRDVDQERPGRARSARPRLRRASELGLERAHQLLDVEVDPVGRTRLELHPHLAVRVVGQEVSDEDPARLATGADRDRRHQVEAEERQVGEIVLGQRLAAQVRVDQAQPAEAPRAAAQTSDVRQHQLRCVPHDDVLDRTSPVDQDPDLAVELRRDLAHGGGELVRNHLTRRHAPPVDALQRLDLAGLEALCIAA